MAFTRLCEQLAAASGTRAGDWYPVFKARYGMREVFQAIAEVRGTGSVLTQPFTCCTAVDPILAAGLRASYADISPDNLCLDPARLGSANRAGTRALVVQNTFGLIDQAAAQALAAVARQTGALVVEDSAHCVGRLARDQAGQPLADFSVHSFGVEKILPTRFGGAIWVNPGLAQADPELDRAVRGRLGGLRQPGRRLDLVTRAYRNQMRVLSRLPRPLARPLQSGLARFGLLEPAISPAEQAGRLQYQSFLPTRWVAGQAAAALAGLERNQRGRAQVVEAYRTALAGRVEFPAALAAGPAQPLLRFPLFLADSRTATDLITALRAKGIWAEAWYRPLLFPGVSDQAAYGFDQAAQAATPVSQDLSARVVCLPTELDAARARQACQLVLASR